MRADLAAWDATAERPAWLREAYADPAAFWQCTAAELMAAAPGAGSSAIFEWYTLFHEFGRRHAMGRRAAFREFSPAAGFREVSYDELVRQAQVVAGAWQARGVLPGASVCVVLEPSPTYMLCVLAAWCCGAIVCIIPPDGPSFVRRALAAGGAATGGPASPQPAPPQPAPPPSVFVVAGTKARPWLSELDRTCLLHWEVPVHTEPLRSPYRFPADAIAVRAFSSLADDWDHPAELSAEQLYFSALRDGLLLFELRAGQSIAAPGFSGVQYKPALLLMTFACGATWAELDMTELADGRALLDGQIDVLGVTGAVRDLLCRSPRLSGAKLLRWFRNVAEDGGLAAWAAFESALAPTGALGMNYFGNSAAGGSILFSAWSTRPSASGVWRTPGLPCELSEPNGTGMPPLGDVGMLTPLKAPKNTAGIRAGVPPSAIGRPVIASTASIDIWVTNLGSHRGGVVLPERQLEAMLASAYAEVRAAVLVALPAHHHAGEQRVALLVFVRPGEQAAALGPSMAEYLRAELGSEHTPDRVEVFELNPKLIDPKADPPEVDRSGCAGQYISGTLWGKSRRRTFRELAALSGEVALVRQYKALAKREAEG